jgi:[acyl-carrier-protein] S-malonyltransferase
MAMVAYLFPGQGRNSGQTQTEVFQASIASFRAVFDDGRRCMVAGLSLGEFGALCAADATSEKTCLDLLRHRQALMDEACTKHPGTMAAILGIDVVCLETICREVGDVVVANHNSPKQLVVSGKVEAVQQVIEQVKKFQVRAIRLKVSGGFHSPLMDEASAKFARVLGSVSFGNPAIPFYSSVSGERVEEPEKIRCLLCRQMTSPVLFEKVVRNLLGDGATDFVEVGEGGVITKLVADIVGNGAG